MRRLFISAIALLSLASVLGSCLPGDDTTDFDAIFSDIGNLAPLAQVQASDVRIGQVRGIRLEGYTARVSISIRGDLEFPDNSVAFIRSTSLLGEQLVEIRNPVDEPPSQRSLRDGQTIPLSRTGKAPTLDEALIQLGEILEGGEFGDFAAFINSSAEIVRGKEEQLGEVFGELRKLTGTLAGRAPDIGRAIDSLDSAFATLAQGSATLSSSVSSSADASAILANQQKDLDRLVDALDRFSAVSARYTRATTPASDRALKDLRLILDQVMKSTDDLDKSLSALARFTDLWPKVIPGDYVQLDVVVKDANQGPASTSAGGKSSAAPAAPSATSGRQRATSLRDLMMGAAR
jgi:phospholipid/cholesterol/gamma-HCH transport system substrate-binding protein